MASTPMQQYRPWRFLVLLVTLFLLLVIQPMVRGFSIRGSVFDIFYSLVLVAAILSLCHGRWPTRLALILGVPALLGRWLALQLRDDDDGGIRRHYTCVPTCPNAILVGDHDGSVLHRRPGGVLGRHQGIAGGGEEKQRIKLKGKL